MAKEDVKLLITADGQKAIKEISEVTQHMGKFGSGVNNLLSTATSFVNWQTAAVGAITAAGAAFGKLMVDALNTADEMANMSKRTGIAVESLSRLSYVAKMSDTDMGTLQKSMKFLNNALYDVSKGNQAAIDKFKEFGVEVYNADGTVKNAEQALIATAEAYSKLESDAAKTALATEVFGKAGQELMPMLSEGAEGIKNLTDEAERMGVVISADTAAAAEEFNDKLDKMKTFAQGVAIQVLENLVPNINELNTEMDEFNKTGSAVSDTADIISTGLDIIGFAFNNLTYPMRTVLGLLAELNEQEKTMDKFTGAWTKSQKIQQNAGLLMGFHTNTSNTGGGGSGGKGGSKTSQKNSNDFIDFIRVRPRAKADSGFGLADQWVTDLTAAAYGDPEKIGFANGKNALSPIEMLDVPALDPNILRDRQQPLIDQWAAYYEELQEMGTTNFLIMNETTQQLFGGMGEAITGIGNLMSSMAGKTQQDYQAMFEIGKAFKSAEIVTSTYSAAVKAYESQVGIPVVGPALAVAAAASAIAFGTAQLANLWAAQPGQSSISGASAAPTPSFASRNPQGGSGGGSSRNITIKFEGFIWDKDRLAREIVPAIDRALADGIRR